MNILLDSVLTAVRVFILLYGVVIAAVILALVLIWILRCSKTVVPKKSERPAMIPAEGSSVLPASIPITADDAVNSPGAPPGVKDALTSLRADVEESGRSVVLDGNTLDLDPRMKISGDKIVVWLGSNGQAEKIIAEGNVTIQQGQKES